MTIGRDSYVLNLFNVIKLYIDTNDKVKYEVGDTGAPISPVYDTSNDTLDITQWNYVAATLKHMKNAAGNEVYIQLSVAQGRTATLLNAGEASVSLPSFSTFSNTIMIGGDTEALPKSFDGFLKDVRFFDKFHSFEQLEIDQLKLYQPYGYDDPNMIAFW